MEPAALALECATAQVDGLEPTAPLLLPVLEVETATGMELALKEVALARMVGPQTLLVASLSSLSLQSSCLQLISDQ